jgi:hypothetical protein
MSAVIHPRTSIAQATTIPQAENAMIEKHPSTESNMRAPLGVATLYHGTGSHVQHKIQILTKNFLDDLRKNFLT